MRSSTLFNTLQNLIDFKPTQQAIADILCVKQGVIGNRVARDSNFSDEEVKLIEEHYGVQLITSNDPDKITLDFYPDVFGSCGTGCIVFDETKDKISVTKDLINNYSASNTYSVISARGSSMAPRIEDNDKLIIQKWNGEQIIDDNVYLFRYNDELFIKRLVKNIDQVICISENPRFEDRVIKNLNDFTIIGRVVGLIRERV